MIAVQNIDEVIQIHQDIARPPKEARTRLSERFGLSEPQTQAIVDMRLRALTSLAVEELQSDIDEIHAIKSPSLSLSSATRNVLRELIKSELREVSEKYGNARRTQIKYAAGEFNEEDF